MGYKLFQIFSVERLDAAEGDRILSSAVIEIAMRRARDDHQLLVLAL